MNPLHVIGLCEVRSNGVTYPRRKTIVFASSALADSEPYDKTIVTDEIVEVGAEATLGVGTPATATIFDPETEGNEYQYDERGGEWFGIDDTFSALEVFYIQATVESSADVIRVQGFAPDPSVTRKTLVNLGPAAVTLSGRDSSGAGMVRAYSELLLLAGDACRIFWDAEDECWRPIQRTPWREVTGFPEGQLVIEGNPLQIQGHPLVITTGALARKPRTPDVRGIPAATPEPAPTPAPEPIVATIIERPQPLAAPPAPRALPRVGGTPIELVDAFADSSLEMDEEGDQFRVALGLQAVIEDLQASDIDQGAAITALQTDVTEMGTEVSAMRFPFPRRISSTALDTYEELGVLRFDATPFEGAVTLEAELEVSATGQTATLELWNLTAGTTVTTLTSTSKVTEKKTASVTLPTSEQLYSVRLKRTGGSATQNVACRSVAFRVTHG